MPSLMHGNASSGALQTARGSRSLKILARQQAEMLREPEVWDGMSGVSLVDENPGLASEPLSVRKALAIRRVLLEMPIRIQEDELIVGDWRVLRLEQDRLPDYTNAEEKARFGRDGLPQVAAMAGHNTADYGTLIEVGLKGIRARAQAALQALNGQDALERDRQRGFYRAVIICCDAVRDLAGRYAALAERLAHEEKDPVRAAELRTIASVCRNVPENPASSFHESIQSLVLYHIALHSVFFDAALGRLDQFFYPLLRADLDRQAITYGDAQELIDCFALKINDCAWHGSLSGERLRSIFGYPVRKGLFHNAVLSGRTPDGRDATNDVTYMILDALRRLATVFPTVSVRLHSDSPEELVRACCRVLRTGAGAPALYNDEVFIPALLKAGIPLQDARDYANDGCWEVTIGGKTRFSYTTFFPLSCLEWTLTRGRGLPIDWPRALGWKKEEESRPVPPNELSVDEPDQLGVRPDYRHKRYQEWRGRAEPLDTGDPCAFQSFEELMAALERQIEHQVRWIMTRYVGQLGKSASNPLGSALVQDCLARGRDFCEGGVRYDIRGVDAPTVGNTADALCAIRRFVFEEQTLTLAQ